MNQKAILEEMRGWALQKGEFRIPQEDYELVYKFEKAGAKMGLFISADTQLEDLKGMAQARQLSPNYLFPFIYEQYIAYQTKNPSLNEYITTHQNPEAIWHGEPYWPIDEFEPIAVAMDKLFSELGWKRS